MSPAFRRRCRELPRRRVARAAATVLRPTRAPVMGVAFDVGFDDLSHFTTSFTRAFGVSPRAFRSRAS